MVLFKTELHGYSVEFSPFAETRLACATSQYFGIVGNGRQYVLDAGDGEITKVAAFDTQDGLYDCTWSEENENVLVSGSGDGSVKVWDVQSEENPLRSFEEHTAEVYSVDWNLQGRETFLSGSWDDTIKLWSLMEDHALHTFQEHRYCVYSTVWSPSQADVFASASGDCTIKIWDANGTYARTLTDACSTAPHTRSHRARMHVQRAHRV